MSASPDRRRDGLLLAGLCAVALALRWVFATRKGLVLDEFHSYFHATRGSWGELAEGLARDNHPPFAFLAIGAARAVLGDAEWALRLPAMLAGTLEVWLAAVIARRAGAGRGLAAAALVAASSLHLDFSTQVRMYAWLSVAVIGTLEALTAALRTGAANGPPPGGWWRARLVLWLVVGAHSHYFFVQYVLWGGLATLVWGIASGRSAELLRRFVVPLLVAFALCAPWYLTGFRAQLGHELAPGGRDVGIVLLGEAFVHLFFLNVRQGGEVLRVLYIGAGVLVFAMGAWGAARALKSARGEAATWLLPTVALVVPTGAVVLAALWPRAGFTWHYVLPSATPIAVLAASTLGGRGSSYVPRALFGLCLSLAALLSVQNALGRGTEDFPGAIQRLLEEWAPGTAVVTVEWQPEVFPQHQPWNYYAPRLSEDPPRAMELNAQRTVVDRKALRASDRALFLRTDLPRLCPIQRILDLDFEEEWAEEYGFGVWLVSYRRR